MENEIYLILKIETETVDSKGNKHNSAVPIGSVVYNDLEDNLILIINNDSEVEFTNIIEIIKYTEEKNWLLCDMQGDLYDLKTHMDLVRNINKIGCGYIFR